MNELPKSPLTSTRAISGATSIEQVEVDPPVTIAAPPTTRTASDVTPP